ncbi:TraB/GumN family protein [Asticcacaulis sp. YBE204]|uniref:TraB/GumN family protein n=1 Tax=Asticcacaulis sp. YBE204 TaxID=1282363 RepID=UPI0003C3D5ED|nr:TraB/GumN family protein [Asticcacaulis sp. YBE204]ESQ79351.1 hypothetical protein AEYBE204_10100 [Asticcacaulis sp. YBE204]
MFITFHIGKYGSVMFKFALAVVLAVCLIAPVPASAAPASTGLPMWVIKDEDSTLYIVGTAHGLPAGLPWRSAKLDAALLEASDVWFEFAEVGGGAAIPPDRLLSKGPPLSSRLTLAERDQYALVAARLKLTPATLSAMERMTPGAAVIMLMAHVAMAGGLSTEDGIDRSLAQSAKAQGDRISGLETIDDQLRLLISGSEEDQLVAFRQFLFAPEPHEDSADFQRALALYVSNDDVEALTTYFATWAKSMRERPYGQDALNALLRDRNAKWVPQVEQILAGKGVSFIAVGAAHLIGPDNLFEMLSLRGIKAMRY